MGETIALVKWVAYTQDGSVAGEGTQRLEGVATIPGLITTIKRQYIKRIVRITLDVALPFAD
jgi:hypothetical protein